MESSDDHADLKTVAWQMPWYRVKGEIARFFEAELARELCAGHVLHGVMATAVARRDDNDDVLFGISHPAACLAVVHLTYQQESESRWPRTKLFASADDFVRCRMLPDAAGFQTDW